MKRPTVSETKEFCRDYLGTLSTNGKKNDFRSTSEIARVMGITFDEAASFVASAYILQYMEKDNAQLPEYVAFPTLYRVMESHL